MPAQNANPSRFQRGFVKAFRTFFVTLLFTMLGMGLGLMIGILWYAIGGAMNGQHPNMAMAYRNIAIYVAIASGSCALIYQVFIETRTAPRPRS